MRPDLYLCFHGISVILRPWGLLVATWGFPSSSAGKESACNAGDPGSIPGLGRSAEKGIGYPLQSSWASLMAQLVKNLPAMQETWVISLGWEDPLEKRTATHSSIMAWGIPWTAGPGGLPSMGFSRQDTGVGCHFLLQCMKVKSESEVAQSCLTLSNPMDSYPSFPPNSHF